MHTVKKYIKTDQQHPVRPKRGKLQFVRHPPTKVSDNRCTNILSPRDKIAQRYDLYKKERKAARLYSQRAKRQSGEILRIRTASSSVTKGTGLAPYPGRKSLKVFPQLDVLKKGWTMFIPFQVTANNFRRWRWSCLIRIPNFNSQSVKITNYSPTLQYNNLAHGVCAL